MDVRASHKRKADEMQQREQEVPNGIATDRAEVTPAQGQQVGQGRKKKSLDQEPAPKKSKVEEPSQAISARVPQEAGRKKIDEAEEQNGRLPGAGKALGKMTGNEQPVTDKELDDQERPTTVPAAVSPQTPSSDKPGHIKIPKDTSMLRARLTARIEQLRAARKADGTNGKPIQTRQELIEARRLKQAQRRAHKKELRLAAKEEEDRKREEALASARNSPGGILSPLIHLDDNSTEAANNFAFGRVAFADGTQMSHDLSYEKKTEKKKGPSDPKTALLKLDSQKKRISEMDETKRKEVLEKETWLAARKRAEGEKIRDDEALMKKAVKRKERAKKKSEREWKERTSGVEKTRQARQRKREENLRKRRDEKGAGKGKKKGKSVKRNRPGFEGSLGLGGKRK